MPTRGHIPDDAEPRFVISKVDVEIPRQAFEYALGVCRENSRESLAAMYATDADWDRISDAIASDFPANTRDAVFAGCAAGIAEQALRGRPLAEEARAQWFATRADHEQGLASFMRPESRERFSAALASSKSRQELNFHDFAGEFDPSHSRRLEPLRNHTEGVEPTVALLERAGAPGTCFILTGGDLDGHELELRSAVIALLANGAGMISCLAGRLALYIGDNGSCLVLLAR